MFWEGHTLLTGSLAAELHFWQPSQVSSTDFNQPVKTTVKQLNQQDLGGI